MNATDPQDLYRLIYVSSAIGDVTQRDLDVILERSRPNNTHHGLTGLLLYHDGCFFQALEGPREVVKQKFAAIAADARHSGVIVLESRSIAERGFPQWSMGYIGAHALMATQRQWLVDLSTRVCAENPEPLSHQDSVNIHVGAFLSSFREFA